MHIGSTFPRLFALFCILAFLTVEASARSGGITGRTLKGPSPGCSCHGGSSVAGTTVLKAPSFMVVNQFAQCTVLVAGASSGVDIATSSGVLDTTGSQGRLRYDAQSGELTHPSAGSGPYVFRFQAPSSPGSVTIYATGLANDFSGPWGHAISATVTVTTVATGVDDEKPVEFALAQNYPNPFNPSTTIGYTIPQASHVTLEVFSLTGQKVATLVDGQLPAGRYSVVFSQPGLASGVYLYRLQAGSRVEARKFVLLR